MDVPSNITVFLVESRSFYRDLFIQSLGKLGLRGKCILSRNYEESVKKLEGMKNKGERIDLFIIEAELGGGSESLELVDQIRSCSNLEKAGILMISVEDNSQMIISAFEKGIDSYAFKPIEDSTLSKKIEFCWQKRKHAS